MKNRLFISLASAIVAFGGIALVAEVSESMVPEAQAATCYYTNLNYLRVQNVNCPLGAYGYKTSANATTGIRVGAWVKPGYYSYNPNPVCYIYPTMVRA